MRRLVVARFGAVAALCAALGTTGCAADPATLPVTYLRQAQQAVRAQDAPQALDALNKAENLWIGANVPFSSPFFTFDPEPMRAMARARQSIQMGRWADADYYIGVAEISPSAVTPGIM